MTIVLWEGTKRSQSYATGEGCYHPSRSAASWGRDNFDEWIHRSRRSVHRLRRPCPTALFNMVGTIWPAIPPCSPHSSSLRTHPLAYDNTLLIPIKRCSFSTIQPFRLKATVLPHTLQRPYTRWKNGLERFDILTSLIQFTNPHLLDRTIIHQLTPS